MSDDGRHTDEWIVAARVLFDPTWAQGLNGSLHPDRIRDPFASAVLRAAASDNAASGIVEAVTREIGGDPAAVLDQFAELERIHAIFGGSDLADRTLAALDERERRLSIERRLREIDGLLADPGTPLDLIRAELVEAGSFASEPADRAGITLGDLLQNDPADEQDETIRTGLDWLDDALPGGGLTPGTLTALAGAPGMGKSAIALQLTLAALEINADLRVTWAALEMAPKALRNRALVCASGLTLEVLRRPWGMLSPLQEHEKRGAIETLRAVGPRLTILTGPLTTGAIEVKIARTGSRLLVLDYLQLLTPAATGATRREEIDGALRDLVRIGHEHEAALLVLSNMPKGDGRKRDIYSSFKESSEIAHAADLAFVLEPTRPGGDDEDDEQRDDITLRLRCLKARHGAPRSLSLRFIRSRQQFTGAPA